MHIFHESLSLHLGIFSMCLSNFESIIIYLAQSSFDMEDIPDSVHLIIGSGQDAEFHQRAIS